MSGAARSLDRSVSREYAQFRADGERGGGFGAGTRSGAFLEAAWRGWMGEGVGVPNGVVDVA
jgi:hypothetical protein